MRIHLYVLLGAINIPFIVFNSYLIVAGIAPNLLFTVFLVVLSSFGLGGCWTIGIYKYMESRSSTRSNGAEKHGPLS